MKYFLGDNRGSLDKIFAFNFVSRPIPILDFPRELVFNLFSSLFAAISYDWFQVFLENAVAGCHQSAFCFNLSFNSFLSHLFQVIRQDFPQS